MAVYLTDRKWVNDADKPTRAAVCSFVMDNASNDLAALPGRDKIKEGTTVIDVSTGKVYILAGAGWALLS